MSGVSYSKEQIEELKENLNNLLDSIQPQENKKDKYHTMDDLYDHRTVLFALVVSKFPEISWKSYRHSDGTSENGWFIAGMETPYGQISYHQKLIYWNIFQCKELERAPEYDGHTPGHVITRLSQMIEYKSK